MDLHLAELRAFVAVAEELHFGRAALRLGISQPQVSRRIRALEDELGVELFVRTARRTELTYAGALLLGQARETLSAAARLADSAALARRGGHGRVSVAFLWSTLGGYLAPLVSAAAERHPEIALSVAQVSYLELLPALRRGEIDLAISRPTFEQTELTELELCREPAMLALHPDHPLAAQEHVTLAQMSAEPNIAMRRELVPAAYDAILANGRARGLEIHIARHVRSASEALALVSAGIGVYRLAGSAATPFPGVVYREIIDSRSRLVVLHRPLPALPVQQIVALATELFGTETETPAAETSDASDASNDAGRTLAKPHAVA